MCVCACVVVVVFLLPPRSASIIVSTVSIFPESINSTAPSGTRPLFLIVGNRGQHDSSLFINKPEWSCTAPLSLVAMVCTHASRCSGFRDSREPVTIGCTPVALSRTFVCLAALLGRSSSVSVLSASFRCWTKSVLQFLQWDFDEMGFFDENGFELVFYTTTPPPRPHHATTTPPPRHHATATATSHDVTSCHITSHHITSGLRSAVRCVPSGFWASWADPIQMIHQRTPDVAIAAVRSP